MNSHVVYFFVAFAIILTLSTIVSVNGQCTIEGCQNGDPSTSIVGEMQQLSVDAFRQLNKQVQSIREIVSESFQEMRSKLDTFNISLQAVDKCHQEHDNQIKIQNTCEFLNESLQEMKSQHGTVVTNFQAVDQRLLQEHDINIKQGQSIHQLLNESFQEIKSQHDTVITSLQTFDRRLLQHHDIDIKQGQSMHELLNESFQEMKSQHGTVMTSLQSVDQRRSREHDTYIKQGQSIHELLNESFQEMKSQHGTVMTSLQSVDQRRSQEHDTYIKQSQSIHELLNESFQEMKSQLNTVMTSLQAVDRRLQEHDIFIKNQTQNSWKLANDFFDPASKVRDCSDIKASGKTASGVYEVCVEHKFNRICTSAFCDMETMNGASLVFQRRKDGSVNFNRTWADYKQGFGNRNGEFWLGNEMLYLLTSKRNYKLRVDLEDFHGNKSFAEYTTFSISSSANNYRLTVSGYSGTAGDSLAFHSGKQFSTIDVDNDKYQPNPTCAQQTGGGWWFENCFYSSLNGIYYHQYQTPTSHNIAIKWYHWRGWYYSLKATEMKLVPVA